MSFICSRYIFLHLLKTLLVVGSGLISTIWLAKILRYSYLYNKGINFTLFGKLSFLILPDIILQLLPFITFLSLVFGYCNLQKSGELISFFTLGANRVVVGKSGLTIGLIATVIALCLSFQVKPLFVKLLSDNLKQANTSLNENFFELGKINSVTKRIKIYAEKKVDNNLINVFILDTEMPKDITFAHLAQLYISKDGILMMHLNDCKKYFANQDMSLSHITFKQIDIQVKNLFGYIDMKNLENYNLHTLWDKETSLADKNELASAVIWPFYNLILSILAITLLLWNCNIAQINVIITLIGSGILLIIYFTCLQLASNYVSFIYYRFIVSAAILCLFSYIWVKR